MSTCVPHRDALAQPRVDALLGACADPRTPPARAAELYLGLASDYCGAGGRLAPDERLRFLLSDDVVEVLDVIATALELVVHRRGIGPLVDIRRVPDGDGIRTLEALSHERFSLVALDVDKPRLSGPSVITALRGDRSVPWRTETQAVLITAYADSGDFSRAGVNGYIKKPFRARDMEILFGYAARDLHHLASLRRACLGLPAR